jgi:phage tail-like protein
MAMAENTSALLPVFNFRVKLRRSPQGPAGASETDAAPQASGQGLALGEGGFQECTGLDIEMDVQELVEGGRNDGVIRRVGRGKFQNIILKRGMFIQEDRANGDLWRWLQSILTGTRPVPRYDGTIEVLDRGGEGRGEVLATWTFDRGLPAKVSGPQLHARTGEIALEELHIAHEGLRLED